nr:hypothetical protein 32 [Balneolaceae bacterium]
MYTRTDREKVDEGKPLKYGFHTNQATKTMIINRLIAALRDEEYIERDEIACNEMDYYEIKEDGTMGAKEGTHDDVLITTAGGVWLALNYMQPPQFDKTTEEYRNRRPRRHNEAMI